MIVAIIGNRSVKAIEDVIKKNFDNLDLHAYKSITHFINEMSVRSLDISRMVIMQDGIQDEPDLQGILTNFFEYLAKYYPAMRIVSLAKDVTITHTIASIFISPLCAHIVASTVKPRMILDMVGKDIEAVRNEYGYKEIKAGESDLVEAIDDVDEPEGHEEVVQQQGTDETGDNKESQKKKKGLFGLFGGKKNKKKETKQREAIGQVALDREVEPKPPIPEYPDMGDGVNEDDYFAKLERVELEKQQAENANSEEHHDDDVNFSIYGSEMDDMPTLTESEPEEEQTPTLQDLNFNSSENNYEGKMSSIDDISEKISVSLTKEEEKQTPIENVVSEVENNNSTFAEEKNTEPVTQVSDVQDDNFIPELDMDDVHTHQTVDTPFDDVNINIDDKKKRIQDLSKEALGKEIDTDLSDIKTPEFKAPEMDIASVEDDDLDIDDIADLQKAYQEQTAPVVEKVVERVVSVNRGARSKNGVKYIVITGDRRSGVTRSALQLATYFAKQQSTLYVDCDLERRGSLAYLDLEDILDCQEFVCNGLGSYKRLNNLTNVTYRDMKHKFDCLISLYDNEIEPEDLRNVVKLLGAQRDYSTVIFDCPLEQLSNLSSILPFSDIFMCIESNYLSMVNTIIGITTSDLTDDDLLSLYNGMKYLVTKGLNEQAFNESMQTVASLFDLANSDFDWSTIQVGATIKNLGQLVNNI